MTNIKQLEDICTTPDLAFTEDSFWQVCVCVCVCVCACTQACVWQAVPVSFSFFGTSSSLTTTKRIFLKNSWKDERLCLTDL